MRFRKLTPKTLPGVIHRILKHASESEENARVWCANLDDLLDNLYFNDFFGTEGQCDPRGDHRN